MLIDTHCHIHESSYPLQAEEVIEQARTLGVEKMICIGTDVESATQALRCAEMFDQVYATVGVHPHEAKHGVGEIEQLIVKGSKKLVGIGEIGLDYYYTHSPRDVQIAAFEQQLQWAQSYHLPVSFHVRDAFDDFWPVLDNFSGIRGVLHSFTDSLATMEKAVGRGLYIGVNGISTFTKDASQQDMFRCIPLKSMLLETDAPFLTPAPYRGKVNEPGRVREVAQFHASIRNLSIEEIAARTSQNATALFGI